MSIITVFNQEPQARLPVTCLSVAHPSDVIESSACVLNLLLPLINCNTGNLTLGHLLEVSVFPSAILCMFSPDTISHSVPLLLVQYQLSPHYLFLHWFICDRRYLLSIHCLHSASSSYRDTRPMKAILVFTAELEPARIAVARTQ